MSEVTQTPEVPETPVLVEETLESIIEAVQATEAVIVPEAEVSLVTEAAIVPEAEVTLVTEVATEDDGVMPAAAATVTAPNVEEHFDTNLPSDRGSPDTLNIPPENNEVVYAAINNTAGADISMTQNQFAWKETLRDSLNYLTRGGAYVDRLADGTAGWTQSLEYKGQRMHATIPARKSKPGVTELEGEMALLQVVTHLGIGGLATAPMYNSGFWVRFKPANEAELMELNIMLASDKIQLGRESYGLAHTNHIVYTLDRVFNMALQHVYSTSVKAEEMPINLIPKYLKPQDIHSFIWGFLCASYPNGFKYETACVTDPTKCQHVFKGTLALNKLQVVDKNALTDQQKNHMLSNSTNSMTLESVLKYQEAVSRMHDRRIVINEGTQHEIAIVLKTPTIPEYIEQGMKHIDGIVDAITSAMATDASNQERHAWMRDASNSALLCQYIHFVKSIEIGQVTIPDGSVVLIKDTDTLLKTLRTLSSIDSIRDKVIKEVLKYIGESTLSLIATPAYDCPICKGDQSEKTEAKFPRHRAYVPVDIFQVFFGLLAQRLNRISNRG